MTILNLQTLEPIELISHYILDLRGQGLCLPYNEHLLLCRWFELASKDADLVLLVLSELVPDSNTALAKNGRPLPLKVFDKKICERIRTYSRTSQNSDTAFHVPAPL